MGKWKIPSLLQILGGEKTKNNKDDNNKNKIANILMDKHPETQFGSIWSQKLVKY